MVLADLARGGVLIPVAVAGLFGHLDLWMLVLAAAVLETATSYFEPAYGALLPTLVERRNLLNAASFFASALLISGVRARGTATGDSPPRIREAFVALRPRPVLATAVAALAVGVTIGSGAWVVGVPQLVRKTLDLGAGSFSAVSAGYAVGAVTAGAILSRVHVRQKARASFYLWVPYAAACGLFAIAGSLPVAIAAGTISGAIQSALLILLFSAAQEEIPDAVLGRVVGLISLVHRGAHATGLLFIGPWFALLAAPTVFFGAAATLPLVGLAALATIRLPRFRVAAAAAPERAPD